MITDKMFKSGKFWTKGPMVVTGCTKVSPGCKNCWSESYHNMRSHNKAIRHIWPPDCLTDGRFNGRVYFNLNALRKAVKGKKPQVIAIWNDLYHEGVMDVQIFSAFQIMSENKQHTYLIITKRPERAVWIATTLVDAASLLSGKLKSGLPLNIIHIATMENQDMADKRMPHLLRIPGKRVILVEPMLGSVDISESFYCSHTEAMEMPFNDVYCANNCDSDSECCDGKPSSLIHQVILGPENGVGKRPFNEEWAESVQAQCESAGVPFYNKGRGEGELLWR